MVLPQVHINDRFAQFSEALYVADRHAREEVRQRALMQQKIASKEKEAKEENLRLLAQRAREERNGVVVQPSAARAAGGMGGSLGGIAGYGSDSEDEEEAAIARGAQGQVAASEDGGRTPVGAGAGRGAASGSEASDSEDEDLTPAERQAAKERAEHIREQKKTREREMRRNNMGTEQRAKMLAKCVPPSPSFLSLPPRRLTFLLPLQGHRSRHFGEDRPRTRQADSVERQHVRLSPL